MDFILISMKSQWIIKSSRPKVISHQFLCCINLYLCWIQVWWHRYLRSAIPSIPWRYPMQVIWWESVLSTRNKYAYTCLVSSYQLKSQLNTDFSMFMNIPICFDFIDLDRGHCFLSFLYTWSVLIGMKYSEFRLSRVCVVSLKNDIIFAVQNEWLWLTRITILFRCECTMDLGFSRSNLTLWNLGIAFYNVSGDFSCQASWRLVLLFYTCTCVCVFLFS